MMNNFDFDSNSSKFDLNIVIDLLHLGKWVVTSRSVSVYLGKRKFFENELEVMMQQYLLVAKESVSEEEFYPFKLFNIAIRDFLKYKKFLKRLEETGNYQFIDENTIQNEKASETKENSLPFIIPINKCQEGNLNSLYGSFKKFEAFKSFKTFFKKITFDYSFYPITPHKYYLFVYIFTTHLFLFNCHKLRKEKGNN